MKEAILFHCGHTVEVELPNNEKARLSMRQRIQERSCRTCDYQEKVLMAQQRAVELGLLSLRGTPKQIDYANFLRGQQVDLFLRQFYLIKRADPQNTQWKVLYQHLLSTVNEQRIASWWIEHQNLHTLQSLLGKCWKEAIDE